MSLSIYKIASEYQAILNKLYDEGHDEQTINDTLDSLNLRENLEEKAVSLAAFIKNLELEAEALRKAIDELVWREGALLNKIERNKSYLLYALQECKVKKINSPEFAIRVCSNNQKAAIKNQEAIPAEYLRITQRIEPDKKRIKEALKQGIVVPGCELVQEQRLEIK